MKNIILFCFLFFVTLEAFSQLQSNLKAPTTIVALKSHKGFIKANIVTLKEYNGNIMKFNTVSELKEYVHYFPKQNNEQLVVKNMNMIIVPKTVRELQEKMK